MEKFIFRVGGQEKMEPMLMSGDEIACIKTDFEALKYYGGYMYYIEYTNGLTTIRRVEDVGESIIIKCEDGSECQTIPKEYVQTIYRVIASARRY